MIPGLGKIFDIDIEVIEKDRTEYGGNGYPGERLPVALAIVVDGEVIVEKTGIGFPELKAIIESRLETGGQNTVAASSPDLIRGS